MLRRWLPLLVTAVLLVAACLFVALFAARPADCGRVGVRPSDWTAEGVVVEAEGACPLRDGDLVTRIDGTSIADTGAHDEVAEDRRAAGTVDLTVVRDDRPVTVLVELSRPAVLPTLLAAWPTMTFVGSFLVMAGYVWWRRPDVSTGALLVFAAGLGTSTIPTLLGLPVVGVPDGLTRGLYLGLTQVGYLTGWAGGLAFALFFPRPLSRLDRLPMTATWAIVTTPLWVTGAWAAAVAPGSANRLEWVGRVISGSSLVVVAALVALAGLSVTRLRLTRDALERQQMRWLVGTTALAVSAGLAGWFLPQLLLGESLPTAWIGLAALPFVVGLGVAVTRHRLFDLELVLNRGLVYGLLTTSVVSLYLVVVTVAGAVMRDGTTTPAAIVATAVVAVAVNPLRVGLQRGVSRLLYGDRDDPYSALSRLGRRFDAGSADLLPAVAEDVADALRAPYVVIEVPALERQVEAGTRPRWLTADDLVEFPLVDRGEPIGTLRLAARAPGAPYGTADRRLVEDLARQVGAAARELSLRTDLQRSRERIVLAREEERRRLRRALHDELGPAIAGVGLRTEAARRLVESDPDGAADALAAVREATTRLVGDVRRLAYDLRPPALDELGLAGALQQHVGDIDTPRVTVSTCGDLGALPAAVETAAYRIAVEAVANTVRHADATSCRVQLGLEDSRLEVRVVDDGVGLPDDVVAGVGISAMRERAAELGGQVEVANGSRGGTTVVAELPLAGGAA